MTDRAKGEVEITAIQYSRMYAKEAHCYRIRIYPPAKGMPMIVESFRTYKTEQLALRAGRRFVKRLLEIGYDE